MSRSVRDVALSPEDINSASAARIEIDVQFQYMILGNHLEMLMELDKHEYKPLSGYSKRNETMEKAKEFVNQFQIMGRQRPVDAMQ